MPLFFIQLIITCDTNRYSQLIHLLLKCNWQSFLVSLLSNKGKKYYKKYNKHEKNIAI